MEQGKVENKMQNIAKVYMPDQGLQEVQEVI